MRFWQLKKGWLGTKYAVWAQRCAAHPIPHFELLTSFSPSCARHELGRHAMHFTSSLTVQLFETISTSEVAL